MAVPYPTLANVREVAPDLIRVVRKQNVQPREAVKAVWVTASYGLSVYPGEVGTEARFGAAPPNMQSGRYGRDEAVSDIELLMHGDAEEGKFGALPAIPWNLLVPFLMQLLQELLAKWLTPKPA